MKNFLVEIICGILFCIALIGGIYKYGYLPERNKQSLIKQNCEKICTSLSLTIEDYYECCNECYEWESSK